MVTFTEKFTGAKAHLFAKVCQYYMEAAERMLCNGTPDEIPLFSWLSPYQRVQLVRQVMVGLLCPNEPLPPNTVQHYAAFRAIVETLKTEIEGELDIQWDCDNVGEDLRLDDDDRGYRPRSDEEEAQRSRNKELIRDRAERNKHKLDKKDVEDVDEYQYEEEEYDFQKGYGTVEDIAGSIFGGKPLSKNQRSKIRKPSNQDEQFAFRWRCLCDDAFQEDTTNHFPLLPLSMVNFDFRSNNRHKWYTAIDLLFITCSGAEVDRKENSLIVGAIDERAYADKSQHSRIQTIKKHISILRKIYETSWDASMLSEDQRCIFALSSNEIYGGYGHKKFVNDFVLRLESHNVSFTEPGNYQQRLDAYKEIALSSREGLQYPFHSAGEHFRHFEGCDSPGNYKEENGEIIASCANDHCYIYDTKKLQACSGCLVVCYCSKKCQLAHFKTHKKDCKAMAKLRKDKEAVAVLAKGM